jgi:hypothetical protein
LFLTWLVWSSSISLLQAGRYMCWPGLFASEAACPGCGAVSRRVHSRYQRKLADTVNGGHEVLMHLQAQRFFCGNDAGAKARLVRP